MEELESAQSRLDNIRGVEPIISGLRTISLGSWQAAISRKEPVGRYVERLGRIMSAILPHLPDPGHFARQARVLPAWLSRLPLIYRSEQEDEEPLTRVAALVIGSERGLCGQFNAALAERTKEYLSERSAQPVDLMALGSRLMRTLDRRGHTLAWHERLSVTSLPSYTKTVDWTQRWLARYEDESLDAVDVIYNAYHGTATYEPTVVRLIPPAVVVDGAGRDDEALWPPSIIETDPLRLYVATVEQWTAVKLYSLLLDSVAAEHSKRYQLLESAVQNIERIIGDLTLTIQAARQYEITQEMQELAVGAGLLENE